VFRIGSWIVELTIHTRAHKLSIRTYNTGVIVPPTSDSHLNAHFCLASGQFEHPEDGGFDRCCDRPDWHLDVEQHAALVRHGYDPALPPRGVTGGPERVRVSYQTEPLGEGWPGWPYLRNHVCELDGIQIDGHEMGDLDPVGPGSTCLHCDYTIPCGLCGSTTCYSWECRETIR
jgi:hypothetical protein